jgi:hypothetical protein
MLRRGCSPKISIRSVSSARTVETRRSAKQFARDTAVGLGHVDARIGRHPVE